MRTRSTRISAPPPGMLSSPASIKPRDHVRHRQRRQPRDVHDLRRRQRVQPERRVALLHAAEQIFVPLQTERRGCARPGAATGRRRAGSSRQSCGRSRRTRACSLRSIRRAGRTRRTAARDADVRVVDVAVDDVGDEAVGMLLAAHGVGQPPELHGRCAAVEVERSSGARQPRRRNDRRDHFLSALISGNDSAARQTARCAPTRSRRIWQRRQRRDRCRSR